MGGWVRLVSAAHGLLGTWLKAIVRNVPGGHLGTSAGVDLASFLDREPHQCLSGPLGGAKQWLVPPSPAPVLKRNRAMRLGR